MKTADPLHVKKRVPSGKVQFHTHLVSSESVALFDVQEASTETKRITNILLRTGGHSGQISSGLNHHQQAHRVLEQARALVQTTSAAVVAASASATSPEQVFDGASFDQGKKKQVASIHHAVLRLLSDAACCPSHAAMLTDAGSFFRTSFVDSMVALRHERENLQKQSAAAIGAAKLEVERHEKLMESRTAILRNVLERNARRTCDTLLQSVIHEWGKFTTAAIATRRRKERSRVILLHAIQRRTTRGTLAVLFASWQKYASNSKQARRLATNLKEYEESASAQRAEMKMKVDRLEEEKVASQQQVKELEGLLEVVVRSATNAAEKLESVMERLNKSREMIKDKEAAADEDDSLEDAAAAAAVAAAAAAVAGADMSPRSMMRHDIATLNNRLNSATKRMLDSGDFKVITSEKIEFQHFESQTEASFLSGRKVQEQQTEINLSKFASLEKLANRATENSASLSVMRTAAEELAAKGATKAPTDASTDPMPLPVFVTSSSQTRLNMTSIGQLYDTLSKLQGNNERLKLDHQKMSQEHEAVKHQLSKLIPTQLDGVVVPVPVIVPEEAPVVVPVDKEAKKKLAMLRRFFKKSSVEAASDFTDQNLEDLVSLLDIHEVHPGDVIIQQGEEATWFGMLLAGELDVVIDGVGVVATMKSGTLLGELGFLGGNRERTAGVSTKTAGVVAAIPYRRILALQDASHELFMKFMLLVAEAGISNLFGGQARLKKTIEDLKNKISAQPAGKEEEASTEDKEEPPHAAEEVKVEEPSAEKEEPPAEIEEEKSLYDSGSDYEDSEHGSDISASGSNGKRRKKKHRKRKSNLQGTGKKKRGAKFLHGSNNEVFYRTKVAQAQKSVEDMHHELEREEKEMNRLRAKYKGEQIHAQQMEKEMEFMRMKLAALGLM